MKLNNNITAERKAKLLYGKMLNECGIHSEAVECAMIAVDEVIDALYDPMSTDSEERAIIVDYWQSVKTELQKM